MGRRVARLQSARVPAVARQRAAGGRAARAPATQRKNALRAWIELIKCAKRIESRINGRFVGDHGSSLSRFDVLANLERSPGRKATATVLSRMLLASKGNITRLLDRMEDDGLIRRVPSERDRRVSLVEMTRAGAALFAELALHHEDWTSRMFGVLEDDELQVLANLLRKLRTQGVQGGA